MDKPKAAFYWCASCGGCEESLVDLNEAVIKVLTAVDMVLMPVAMDFKYEDVRKLADKEITVSFINGAIRTSEQEELVKLLRKKSIYVIAYGACSHLGGVPGLANFYKKESILDRAYIESESTVNPEKKLPKMKTTVEGKELELPEFYDRVYALNQVIDVDYYIPGCPPVPDVVKNAIVALLKGALPPKGSILTPNKSLCKDCPRQESKPDKLSIKEFKRPYEIMDNGDCFLQQGVICLGISTRTGCESSCINANMPCRGCFGPTDNVMESGSKASSAISSIIDTNDEQEIDAIMDTIVDPAGLFYRYSLPASILGKNIKIKK
ncbi:MAG: oxidoreductase [Spirochaetes bacterium]|nr:oxidoreductase [Spirochaetota bacterium]